METFNRIRDIGVIPAIRTSVPAEALRATEAIQLGGIDVVEISLAPHNGLDVLDAVATSHGRSVLVGAGSVVNAESARQAALAGAQFIVSPGFNVEAVAMAKHFGLTMLSGALSPTEVQEAISSGASAVKLFPCFAVGGGSRYLKSLIGQYPSAKFIASGGVGLENCADFIRAGAVAIGVGKELADSDSLTHGEYHILTVRAKRLREAVHSARIVVP